MNLKNKQILFSFLGSLVTIGTVLGTTIPLANLKIDNNEKNMATNRNLLKDIEKIIPNQEIEVNISEKNQTAMYAENKIKDLESFKKYSNIDLSSIKNHDKIVIYSKALNKNDTYLNATIKLKGTNEKLEYRITKFIDPAMKTANIINGWNQSKYKEILGVTPDHSKPPELDPNIPIKKNIIKKINSYGGNKSINFQKSFQIRESDIPIIEKEDGKFIVHILEGDELSFNQIIEISGWKTNKEIVDDLANQITDSKTIAQIKPSIKTLHKSFENVSAKEIGFNEPQNKQGATITYLVGQIVKGTTDSVQIHADIRKGNAQTSKVFILSGLNQ